MRTKELIDSAVAHLRASASAKTVYGEPVTVEGKTIIPVARVVRGSGGGKAAAAAKPVGVVEVSDAETRFVPFGQARKFAMVAGVGSGLGLVLGWLLGRRRNDGRT
jgi:uncharacterized spore protein YtfJ